MKWKYGYYLTMMPQSSHIHTNVWWECSGFQFPWWLRNLAKSRHESPLTRLMTYGSRLTSHQSLALRLTSLYFQSLSSHLSRSVFCISPTVCLSLRFTSHLSLRLTNLYCPSLFSHLSCSLFCLSPTVCLSLRLTSHQSLAPSLTSLYCPSLSSLLSCSLFCLRPTVCLSL